MKAVSFIFSMNYTNEKFCRFYKQWVLNKIGDGMHVNLKVSASSIQTEIINIAAFHRNCNFQSEGENKCPQVLNQSVSALKIEQNKVSFVEEYGVHMFTVQIPDKAQYYINGSCICFSWNFYYLFNKQRVLFREDLVINRLVKCIRSFRI